MQVGVIFPQTEIGPDAGAVRAYAQLVDAVGFRHVLAYDHVLGADPAVHHGWAGPYDFRTEFHEPLVLFGYLAALTSLEMVTGIVILPQRQTALVAKQAAAVDVLSAGRLRLGIGLGWNRVEYEALGKDFATRGRRVEEQVELLRLLWTTRSVSFRTSEEHVAGAGIAPLPVQRPIPIWFGAASPAGYRRAGRLGDGWFPQTMPGPEFEEARAIVDKAALAVGRNPASLGIDGQVRWTGNLATLIADVQKWQRAGATHVSINTMRAGLSRIDDHLAVLAQAATELGLDGSPRLP
jgi:probable F420-dependent oxidoreductase